MGRVLAPTPRSPVTPLSRGEFTGATIALHGTGETVQVAVDEEQDRASLFCGYLLEEGRYDPARRLLRAIDDPAALARLNGIYAAAVWDNRTKRLALASDRYGMRPLYYCCRDGAVHFASEIKALAIALGGWSLDADVLVETVCIGNPLADGTLYAGIRCVPPATVVVFSASSSQRTTRYWWWDRLEPSRTASAEDYMADTSQIVRTTVRELASRTPHALCAVSAGFDSRRLLLELGACGANVTALTVATPFHQRFEIDRAVTAELCRRAGLRHVATDLPDTSLAERFAHVVSILTDAGSDEADLLVPLLRCVRDGDGVNFDGLAGDRLLGAFYHEMPLAEVIGADNEDLAARLTVLDGRGLLSPRLLHSVKPLQQRVRMVLDDLPDDANKVALYYLLTRARRKVASFGFGLLGAKVDSWFPYLDNRLVEYVFTHDARIRMTRNFQELALECQFPEFADVPHSHQDLSAVPPRYIARVGNHWREWARMEVARSARNILNCSTLLSVLDQRLRLKAHVQALGEHVPILGRSISRLGWAFPRLGRLVPVFRAIEDPGFLLRQLERTRAYMHATGTGLNSDVALLSKSGTESGRGA